MPEQSVLTRRNTRRRKSNSKQTSAVNKGAPNGKLHTVTRYQPLKKMIQRVLTKMDEVVDVNDSDGCEYVPPDETDFEGIVDLMNPNFISKCLHRILRFLEGDDLETSITNLTKYELAFLKNLVTRPERMDCALFELSCRTIGRKILMALSKYKSVYKCHLLVEDCPARRSRLVFKKEYIDQSEERHSPLFVTRNIFEGFADANGDISDNSNKDDHDNGNNDDHDNGNKDEHDNGNKDDHDNGNKDDHDNGNKDDNCLIVDTINCEDPQGTPKEVPILRCNVNDQVPSLVDTVCTVIVTDSNDTAECYVGDANEDSKETPADKLLNSINSVQPPKCSNSYVQMENVNDKMSMKRTHDKLIQWLPEDTRDSECTSGEYTPQGQRNLIVPATKMKQLEGFTKPVECDKASRMMRRMGWEGGALGRRGDGITEPLAPRLTNTPGAGFGYAEFALPQECSAMVGSSSKRQKRSPPASPSRRKSPVHGMKRKVQFRSSLLKDILALLWGESSRLVADLAHPIISRETGWTQDIVKTLNARKTVAISSDSEERVLREILYELRGQPGLRIKHEFEGPRKVILTKTHYTNKFNNSAKADVVPVGSQSIKMGHWDNAQFKEDTIVINDSDTESKIESDNESVYNRVKSKTPSLPNTSVENDTLLVNSDNSDSEIRTTIEVIDCDNESVYNRVKSKTPSLPNTSVDNDTLLVNSDNSDSEIRTAIEVIDCDKEVRNATEQETQCNIMDSTRLNDVAKSIDILLHKVKSELALENVTEVSSTSNAVDTEQSQEDELPINYLQMLVEKRYRKVFVPYDKMFPSNYCCDRDVDLRDILSARERKYYYKPHIWDDKVVVSLNNAEENHIKRIRSESSSMDEIFHKRTKIVHSPCEDVAIVLHTYPNNKIDEHLAELIQILILKKIYEVKDVTFLPKLHCLGIKNGLLIYRPENDYSADWLAQAVLHNYIGNYYLKTISYKQIINKNDCKLKVLMTINSYLSEDVRSLFHRLELCNSDIVTDQWVVRNETLTDDGALYVIEVDGESYRSICDLKFSVNAGIDQAKFTLLDIL